MLSRRWPKGRAIFALLAALVAFSRLYLHRHYLSDVLFGAALGLVLPWATLRLWPALDPRGATPSVVEASPPDREGEG
jgi:membrane-associated phospholipid phosphatase